MMPGIASSGAASDAGVVATVVKTVFITATGTFTIPADFQSLVSIEAIGSGANGNAGSIFLAGKGGGGGAYSAITSLSGLSPSGSVYVKIGAPGNADTWFNAFANSAPASTSDGVLAKGATGGAGSGASSIGTTKYSGGDDKAGSGNNGGGGPNGAGVQGGTAPAGGAGNAGAAGGGAGATTAGAAGSAGTYWTQTSNSATAGPGGGGAGGNGAAGGAGGNYGAGGGGGGKAVTSPAGGAGAPGIIIFTYNGT